MLTTFYIGTTIFIMKMNDNFLRRYNDRQREEIRRVYNEIKWYVGEAIQRDPSQSNEDLRIVNQRLSEVILNGFGHYLSTLAGQQEIRDRIINMCNNNEPSGSVMV